MKKTAIFLLSLICLCQLSSAAVLYSTLDITVKNQNGEPLEEAWIFLDCPGRDSIYCAGWSGHECYIGHTNADGTVRTRCFGCSEGSKATITAQYRTGSAEVDIKDWKGHEHYLSGTYPAGTNCYGQSPSNKAPEIIISTHCVTVKLMNGIFPIPNETISLFTSNLPTIQKTKVLKKTNNRGETNTCFITENENITLNYGHPIRHSHNFIMGNKDRIIELQLPIGELNIECIDESYTYSYSYPMSVKISNKDYSKKTSSPGTKKIFLNEIPGGEYLVEVECNEQKFEEKLIIGNDPINKIFTVKKEEKPKEKEEEVEGEQDANISYTNNISENISMQNVSLSISEENKVDVFIAVSNRFKEPVENITVEIYSLSLSDIIFIGQTNERGYLETTVPADEMYIISAIYYYEDFKGERYGLIGRERFIADSDKNFTFITDWASCEDGTQNMKCSINKPYVCYFGELISDCIRCGCSNEADVCDGVSWGTVKNCCPADKIWNGTACIERSDAFRIYYLPINYGKSSGSLGVFEDRISRYTDNIEWQDIGLSHKNFYIIYEGIKLSKEDCDNGGIELNDIDSKFKDWYKESIGEGKDPEKEKYRVVGVDRHNTCGDPNASCGYTRLFANPIYANGNECGKWTTHLIAHELGHTFGLCDHYNPDVWERQNKNLQNIFVPLIYGVYGCTNEKPNDLNTGGKVGSCENDSACYFGLKLDEGVYSVMGSADMYKGDKLILRKYTHKSRERINNFLEGVLNE